MKERIVQYDLLKGIGILTVVFMHTWLFLDFRYWCQNWFMAVFFMVAGAFAAAKGSWWNVTKKRFVRIMVPYFIVATLSFAYWFLLERHFREETMACAPMWEFLNIFCPMNMTRYEPHVYNVVLWFLPCMFVASVVFDLMLRFIKNERCLLGGILAIVLVNQFVPFWAPFYLPQALSAVPFMYLGHLLQKYRPVWTAQVSRWYVPAVVLALAILIASYFAVVPCEVRYNRFDGGYLYYFFFATLVNLALYVLTLKVKSCRLLTWAGGASLAIMLMHEPIKRMVAMAFSFLVWREAASLRSVWWGAALIALATVLVCAVLITVYDRLVVRRMKR